MRRRPFEVLAVVLIFIGVVTLVVAFGGPNHRVAADQDLFHLPVIRQFAAQWPRPDLTNYASATAPGYHLAVAAVARYVSGDVNGLRLFGGVFGVALVGLLAWAATPRSPWLALPAAASVYVLTSTAWLLPENAAWLLMTIALLLALHADGRRLLVGSAVVLALLVFVRQSNAWALAAFAAGSLSRYSGEQNRGKGRAIVFTIIAMLPAVVVLAVLVSLWHGLTPPAFQPGSGVELPMATRVRGLAPAAPAMVLALVGVFGTPLLAWLTPTTDPRRVARWLVVGLVIGFVAGVLPETTYRFEHRSGLWNLVQKLPTVAGRSPLIVALATLGGGVAAVALSRLPSRQRIVLATALAGFTLAQMTNAQVWQRYYEPFVLIWLTLAAAWPTAMSTRRWRRLAVMGLIALTLFQLAVTTYVLRTGG